MLPLTPMSWPSFEHFVTDLRSRLGGPLPGIEAQLRMAPSYRAEPDLLQVEGKSCREAAVLILLYPMQDDPTVLLTIRRDDLAHHAGQISLPGGAREAREELSQTALRETQEEVGIHPPDVSLLGALTPLYIPPSQFCVYPFVGVTAQRPEFAPDPTEVSGLLTPPLAELLRPDNRQRAPRTVRGQRMIVPFFEIDTHVIWGATAMILSEFVTLLERKNAPRRETS